MRKLAIIATFFTLAASAAEPRQCQNPDVLNGLVFRGSTSLKFEWNRILPAQLNGYRAPAVFTAIGTAVRRDGRLTRVAYKTDLPTATAYDVMMSSLGAEWQVETEPLRLPGLVNASVRSSGVLCRNGTRRSVLVEDVDGVRYASINLNDERQPRACGASLPDYMPRFEFPAGASVVDGQGGNRSSDFGTASTNSSIRSEASATELIDGLAAQLVAQGWRREAGWSGKGSVGSTWRKSIGTASASGTLEVTGTGAGVHDVDFSVVMPDQ